MYPNTLRIVAATIAVLLLNISAEARRSQQDIVTCNERGCSDYGKRYASVEQSTQIRRGKRSKHRYAAPPARAMKIDKPQEYVAPAAGDTGKLVTIQEYKRSVCTSGRGSTSLARVIGPLRAKAEEIVRECGAVIVSTDCRGGATPNHRNGLAVDIAMRGRASPTCIYAHLNGWPGGVSTDYWSAPGTKHVHFSYSRRHEWGLRFAHSGGGKRHAKRHAPSQDNADQRGPSYAAYADDRAGTPTYAVMDDGSRKGKYKSMRERRKALALQRHAAWTR